MFTIIIPARIKSTRLPGKVLKEINGKPSIQYVYETCLKTKANEIIIATDDESVKAVCEGFGAKCVMTSPDHINGLQRVGEVAENYIDNNDVIVYVQGDEFFVDPEHINQMAETRKQNMGQFITAAVPLETHEYHDPNAVKVILDCHGQAMFYSRLSIPYNRDLPGRLCEKPIAYKVIGLYSFKPKDIIRLTTSHDNSQLEEIEKVEQLRILYYGYSNYVNIFAESNAKGLDTPDDLCYITNILTK